MEKDNLKFKKQELIGTIKSIENVALDAFKIEINSSLNDCIPGQFISILCPNKTLRRPFSIADFDKENKTLAIIFKVKGDGTDYLRNLKVNDTINFLAPLGNGFDIINKKALLVGAGIGIAPMLFLKKEMNKKGIENFLITGFKDEKEIIKGSDKNIIGGSVLDNLEDLIKKEHFEAIYSCGPTIVLRLLAKLCKNLNIDCFLAMEKVMACSIGVCRGCVIKLFKNDEIVMASICKDGPVFRGDEIIW